MLSQAYFPQALDPDELDRFLEQGWFRMGQSIFTTNFLHLNHDVYSAIWLRIVLSEFTSSATQEKLAKQNAAFRVHIQNASIDPIKEVLFSRYRQNVSFEASSSLHQLLFGAASHNVYDTREINIYDGKKLIACGFFDIGKKSAAGISSFYDPDYRKYSLGKYLIFLKVMHCKDLGLRYFYPGYFVPGYPFFDYKLKIGKAALQYLHLASERWLPISGFSPDHVPLKVMGIKLDGLKKYFLTDTNDATLYRYAYFDVNLLTESLSAPLFDFPLFFKCYESEEYLITIVFDVRDASYHLIKCKKILITSSEQRLSDTFTSHLLMVEQYMLSTDSAAEMAERAEVQKKAEGLKYFSD